VFQCGLIIPVFFWRNQKTPQNLSEEIGGKCDDYEPLTILVDAECHSAKLMVFTIM
jgi:hypothetical protein